MWSEYKDLAEKEALGTITQVETSRLEEIRDATIHNRVFPEKVIKYLWDDAFKFNPEGLFDTDRMDSLEKVIRTFVYNKGTERFNIFKPSVLQRLHPSQQ